MAAVIPNKDIVHAIGKGDKDETMEPFEVTKETTKGNAASKYAAQKALLETDMTRVLRSVIILNVKSKDPASKHQSVQFCLPITMTEGDAIATSIDDQIKSKVPEGHCKLWPLEPKLVNDLYKQNRNKLPTKFMPTDSLKPVVIKNVESQADIDSNWAIVAKSTTRASSSGTKRAATAGDKPSKKKATTDDDDDDAAPPLPKKLKPGPQTPSVHEMMIGASSSTTTEPAMNGHASEESSSASKIDLDALPLLHPGMKGTRVALFEMSAKAEVAIVRVAGNKFVLSFSQ
jgi:hypothetical protein